MKKLTNVVLASAFFFGVMSPSFATEEQGCSELLGENLSHCSYVTGLNPNQGKYIMMTIEGMFEEPLSFPFCIAATESFRIDQEAAKTLAEIPIKVSYSQCLDESCQVTNTPIVDQFVIKSGMSHDGYPILVSDPKIVPIPLDPNYGIDCTAFSENQKVMNAEIKE